MSRDWTPKIVDMMVDEEQQRMVENMVVVIGDKKYPMYEKEDIELSHRYKKLGKCGFDFLMICKDMGVCSNDYGVQILQQIEDILNNNPVDDADLTEKTNLWYEGKLEPGCYMDANNQAFADYVYSKMKGSGQ